MPLVCLRCLLAQEDVPEVASTAAARDLDALEPMRRVKRHLQRANVAPIERRPAAARLELSLRGVQRRAACATRKVALATNYSVAARLARYIIAGNGA